MGQRAPLHPEEITRVRTSCPPEVVCVDNTVICASPCERVSWYLPSLLWAPGAPGVPAVPGHPSLPSPLGARRGPRGRYDPKGTEIWVSARTYQTARGCQTIGHLTLSPLAPGSPLRPGSPGGPFEKQAGDTDQNHIDGRVRVRDQAEGVRFGLILTFLKRCLSLPGQDSTCISVSAILPSP